MVSRNYAPFHHNLDDPDHGRAFRVTDAGANSIDVAAGRVRIDQTVTDFLVPTNLAGLANGVNRVYISAAGAIVAAVVGAYPANSIPLARVTVAAADVTAIADDRCFFYEDTAAGAAGNTLDQAYDQGGAGAGRQINAQDGAVLINNPDVDAGIPNLELTRAPADIAAQPILGLRAVGDANFRLIAYGTGQMFWGSGAAGVDVEMLRTAANRLGLAVGDVFEVDTIGSRGGAQVGMEDGVSVPEFLGLPPTLIGIVGGTATPTRSHHALSAEAGVADDLDNLAVGNATDGDICVIRPDTGDTITIRHAQGGAGQLLCIGNANIVLNDDHDFAICIYNSTLNAWMTLCDTGGVGTSIFDADADTGIDAEENADEDKLRFYTGVGGVKTAAGLIDLANPTTSYIKARIEDLDGDTKVVVEAAADEDRVHVWAAGLERARFSHNAINLDEHLAMGSAAAIEAASTLRLREPAADPKGTAIIHADVGFASPVAANDAVAIAGYASSPVSALVNLLGLDFLAVVQGNKNATDIIGCRVKWGTVSPSVASTCAQALLVDTPFRIGGVVAMPTSGFGLRVKTQDPGAGTMTNIGGLLIEPQSGAATIANRYLIFAGALIGGLPRLQLDEGNPGASLSQLWLAVNNGAVVLRQVQIGAVDSGGAGFRGLRVLN